MPEEAINNEKNYRIIIYHGHLHKIPIDKNTEDLQEKKVTRCDFNYYQLGERIIPKEVEKD